MSENDYALKKRKKEEKNACYSSRWRNSYRISAPWLKLADWASECFWWIRYTPELSSRGGQHAKTPPNIFSLHISNTSIDGRHAKYCIKTISILISRQWILKQSQNVTNLKNIKARACYNMAGRDKIFYLQRRREGQWGKIGRIKSLTIGTSLEIETYTYDRKSPVLLTSGKHSICWEFEEVKIPVEWRIDQSCLLAYMVICLLHVPSDLKKRQG